MVRKITANSRPRSVFVRAAGLVLAGAVVASGVTVAGVLPGVQSQAAFAYDAGPGLKGGIKVHSHIHSSGVQAYCLEMGKDIIYGRNDAGYSNSAVIPGYTGDKASYSLYSGMKNYGVISAGEVTGDDVKVINYILHKWGNTRDDHQAANVQFAIWQIRDEHGGNAGHHERIADVRNEVHGRHPGYFNWSVDMIGEARDAIAYNRGQEEAANTPQTIKWTKVTPYKGTATVPTKTVELNVSNGVIKDPVSGEWVKQIRWPEGTNNHVTVEWEGRPPAGNSWGRYYRVEFSGRQSHTFMEYEGRIQIASGGNQATAVAPAEYGRPKILVKDLQAAVFDPDTLFSPVLSTAVPSEFVKKGERFDDTVTFSVAEGSNPWREGWLNGKKVFAPIVANGTLYGPFLSDPKLNPSGRPPVGAPVAGKATVETDIKKGPGVYDVDSNIVAKESGYYTWVWDIDFNNQKESVQKPTPQGVQVDPSLPVNYFFSDGFGRTTEGQTVPTQLTVDTKLSKTEVIIGESFTDEITVNLAKASGGWLQDKTGGRAKAVLRGTAYNTSKAPTRSATVPAEARQIGEVLKVEVSEPGQVVNSAAFTVPLNTEGYVSMVWCVVAEDQPEELRGLIAEGCDDFGVPSESAKILRPGVKTKALTAAALGGGMYDTATVDKNMPKNIEARMSFEVFKKPVAGEPKYDENWVKQLNDKGEPVLFTADEAAAADSCEVQPVAKTGYVRVAGPGEVKSPVVEAASFGVFYWVESLELKDPATGEWVRVHRGKCGVAEETTMVDPPKVTTKATKQVAAGASIKDTATVTGEIAESESYRYELSFEAYYPDQAAIKYDRAGNVVASEDYCKPANRVFNSSKQQPVNSVGEYVSEEFKTSDKHIGKVFWVETLTLKTKTRDNTGVNGVLAKPADSQGVQILPVYTSEVVSRGKCGVIEEISEVVRPPIPELPLTGLQLSVTGLAAGGGLLLFTGAILFYVNARRGRAQSVGGRL